MKNYLVTIRIADGSNYETTIVAGNVEMAIQGCYWQMHTKEIEPGVIICILLSE